jgi:hypothetical protein
VWGDGILYVATRIGADSPMHRVFLNRHAGMQIVHSLMTQQDDGEFPPRGCPPLSLVDLSRKLRVSRPHVKRTLDAAEAEGFIVRNDDGSMIFTEQLRETYKFTTSFGLAQFLFCGARVDADAVMERPDRAETGTVQAQQLQL